MNEPQTNFTPSTSEVGQLRTELEGLRVLIAFGLLAVFIGSMCVNCLLYRQNNAILGQLTQEQDLVNRYQNGGAASVIDFWGKLNDYSRTHPDFNPIIVKYSHFIALHTNVPAAGTVTAPKAAPAPAPAKKK